jgi:hypothetical protein
MADVLEDLIYAEHDAEMWERAAAVWQGYVSWVAEQRLGGALQ